MLYIGLVLPESVSLGVVFVQLLDFVDLANVDGVGVAETLR